MPGGPVQMGQVQCPKSPEPPLGNRAFVHQRLADAGEENVDVDPGLSFGQVDLGSNACSEFFLCHVSSHYKEGRPVSTGPPAGRGTVISFFSVLSHSSSFDQRRRPDTLRTAMATAFFWPTRTTRRLPRVTPV